MVEARAVEQNRVELIGRLGTHFARVEPGAQAGKYVCGLLSDLPRKKCWTLAEDARGPQPGPDAAAAGTRVMGHRRRDGHSARFRRRAPRRRRAVRAGARRERPGE